MLTNVKLNLFVNFYYTNYNNTVAMLALIDLRFITIKKKNSNNYKFCLNDLVGITFQALVI